MGKKAELNLLTGLTVAYRSMHAMHCIFWFINNLQLLPWYSPRTIHRSWHTMEITRSVSLPPTNGLEAGRLAHGCYD